MSFQREPIYVALMNLVTANTKWDPSVVDPTQSSRLIPFKTYSRRLTIFDDVDPTQMPYCCLTTGNETHDTRKPGLQDFILIRAKLYIYVSSPDPVSPGTVWNPVMDQIQNLFPSSMQDNPAVGKQTLGGLVEHVIIKGDVLTFEGTLADKEVGIIPLEILVVS